MQTKLWYLAAALSLSAVVPQQLTAATPTGQAYHRQPVCADGNCAPSRATNGYHSTRWRPWPGGEPSYDVPVPPIGIEPRKIDLPPRDKELELPVRPMAPGENASTQPSPNDKPSTALPEEFRNVTPKKPVEEPLPGNSSLPRGPMFPGVNSPASREPLLLGKKPQPLRSLSPNSPASSSIPADDPPPMLKIRPEGNTQSRLTPEMVPWNEADKNPIVRQTARINGEQVKHTISLDESMLPDANPSGPLTIRVQHQSTPSLSIQTTSATASVPFESQVPSKPMAKAADQETEWRSAANAPAILPSIEAQPLPLPVKMEPVSSGTAVASPLRGVSHGNPLRP